MQESDVSASPECLTERDRRWHRLVTRHEAFVRRCVVRQMGANGWPPRDEEIEDLAQEVFVRLFERTARGRSLPEQALRGYLGSMARSVVVDRIRHRCAAKRGDGRRVSLEALASLPEAVDRSATAEEELLGREARRRLLSRVRDLLPRSCRERSVQIFELAVWEGWTYVEIAARLGDLKPASVATVMFRIRQRLRAVGFGDTLA